MKAPHAVRTLVPWNAGSLDVLVYEFEFEDINELDKFWAEWGETRGDAFGEKMAPLVEHVSSEVWELVE